MSFTNFHMHSHYCDGEGSLDSYVKKAIDKGMYAIGFSSHAPVPFSTNWHMDKEALSEYKKEIENLKIKYRTEINIYSGLEVDYIPGTIGPKNFREQQLDIIIGSIHYVGQFKNGNNCCIDNTNEEFKKGLKTLFDNDIKKLVGKYYASMTSMIKSEAPDIIGHFDLIKKLNHDNRYFNEKDSWYQKMTTSVLKAITLSKCIVEINTRGYYKGITRDFYPSRLILENCFNLNIPVTISSDAHHPDDIENSFGKAASLLLNIGYKKISIFNNSKWIEVDLDKKGLRF